MTDQEAAKKLQDLTEQVKAIKPLTHEEIKQLRAAAAQKPEIAEIRKQIGELKAIDAALTGRRTK